MRTMASALRTFLGDTQPATHHGEPRGFLKVVWCCGMYMQIFQRVSGRSHQHWQLMTAVARCSIGGVLAQLFFLLNLHARRVNGLAHVGSALGGLSGRRRAHATVWTPGCVDLRRSTSISARIHHVRRRGPHRASSLYPPHARSWLGPARHLALTSIPCLPKPPSAWRG